MTREISNICHLLEEMTASHKQLMEMMVSISTWTEARIHSPQEIARMALAQAHERLARMSPK